MGARIERNLIDGPQRLPLSAEGSPAPLPASDHVSEHLSDHVSRDLLGSGGSSPGAFVSVPQPRSKGRRNAETAPPEGVTFQHEANAHGHTKAKFFKNGKQVGSADIRDFGHAIQITNFQVARGARRQGIGTAFQFYIEAQLGKRAVPDGMLSKAEYRRWVKVDPIAVRDYVKGTKNYTPRPKSDAYFAAQNGRPVPGSRAAQSMSARSEPLTHENTPTKPRRKRPAAKSTGRRG
ncbi:hypothetical protein [Hyphomicrobium sp.]|uniref:hypothetical protein n=1 Tax=Hyphomicrobium sp. TaxID=82 RepID=UPI003F6EF70A